MYVGRKAKRSLLCREYHLGQRSGKTGNLLLLRQHPFISLSLFSLNFCLLK